MKLLLASAVAEQPTRGTGLSLPLPHGLMALRLVMTCFIDSDDRTANDHCIKNMVCRSQVGFA